MSCSSITQQTSTTKSTHANPHISKTRVLGFFLQPQPRSVPLCPPLPFQNQHTHPISNTRAPFKTTAHTHTHITPPTLGFLGFSTTTVEKRTTPPPFQKHTHIHTLSRRVRIDTLRKGGRKRICDIFEMVLLGCEVCRYHLLGLDVGAGRSSSNKP